MKTFEYIINIPTEDIDAAKNKLDQLKKTGTDTANSIAASFKSTGQAVKENIKDYGLLGAAGKGAISGLTKGFTGLRTITKSLGTVLKANPIFTLAGIILPLIEIVGDFVKSLGFVQAIMQVVGDAISYVIDLLKSLLDWLGLTSFAEEEAAEKAIKAAEDRKAVNDALYSSMLKDMEREIALLKAQGANIEEIEEKELELARTKAVTTAQTLKEQGQILEAQIRVNQIFGIASAEQVKQLEDLKNAAKDAENALQILEITVSNARQKRIEDDAAKDKKAAEDAAKARQEAYKRRLAEEAAFAADRERIRRQIEDLSTAAIEDQTERELEQNRIKYERLIADTLANEKILQEEKDALIAQFEAEQTAKDQAIRDKKLQDDILTENKRSNTLQELELQLAQQRFDAIKNLEIENEELSLEEQKARIAERAAVEEQLALEKEALELEKLRQQLEAGALTEEEFALRRILLEESTQAQIDGIRDKASKDQVARTKATTDQEKAIEQAKANAIKNISSQVLDAIAANLEEGSEAAKGVAIAQTTFATAQAAVEAFKSTAGIPIVGAVLAPIAAAAAVAFGVSQIRNISSTPKSSSGGGGAASNLQAAVPTQASSAPQLNMFGASSQTGGDSSQFESIERNGQSTVKAVVSWTDIDAVANNDNNIQSEMQL